MSSPREIVRAGSFVVVTHVIFMSRATSVFSGAEENSGSSDVPFKANISQVHDNLMKLMR